MPKSFIIMTMFFSAVISPNETRAYALIDLDPKVSQPTLLAAEEIEGEVAVVEVSRKQRGHLLALVPVSFWVKVVARADGKLEVNYPWYSFMTLTRRAELETKLRAAADNARKGAAVGSVRAEGESAKFTALEAKAVEESLSLVLAEYGDKIGD